MGFWTKKMYSSPGKLKYENQSPLFLLGSSQSNSLILKQSEEAQKVKETELGRKDIDTRTGKLDSKGMNNKEKVGLETIEDKKEKNEDEKPKVNTNEEKRGNEINRSEENEGKLYFTFNLSI
ncbi:hypothetical protein K502DRAFT_102953 [Neoconidiobolus thromboides FSU 785]|nr:hypothetical protein K502DRAFT_102953 [Neoconidiobolus thromboides FSU 785]